MRYIKQLDAMRAIAILFVFCNHACPEGSLLYKASTIVSGPDIFFTISGFLITAILFKYKNALTDNTLSKSDIFKDFFIKRVLRIFPAYYLAILLTYLINQEAVNNILPYLTFTANYSIYTYQEWGRLAHLWSMSVEQQFYLLWPFALVLTPHKFLPYIICLFITIGLYSQQVTPFPDFAEVLPQTCFDALGLGALLAWVISYQPTHFPKAYRVLTVLAILSAAIIVVKTAVKLPVLTIIHQRTLVSLITVWLIGYFIKNIEIEGGKLGYIFNNKYLITLGKVSYGFYLFHLTVLFFCYEALQPFNNKLSAHLSIAGTREFYVTESLLLLIGLAWVSWKYFELPIYALQKHLLPAGRKARRAQERQGIQPSTALTEVAN
ncbi:acyltransferase family protein [Hymenobacter fodinae]|uniref:Acyltransferase n=1 Tax=Hymenobacter fodinae TaxID=2510796 RepID=A0A4Z0P3U6_9BACT|nr:acyltransferase [Hymenobacter fodinae]TGE06222.1 acyltransferase [Hymenobacter fodinae]